MAIETQPESAQAPGGGDPGATPKATELLAEPGHPHRGHRRDRRLHLRPLARQLHRQPVPAGGRVLRRQRLRDRARLLLSDHRLADRARRLRRPGQADARPADQELRRPQRQRRPRQVLQVHPRPQGRRPAVPGRHADLLLHRRPAGDRDQDRAALADVSRHEPHDLPRGGGRARDHDDDDDDLGHPRPVRQLSGALDDRLEAGRVPEDRGAVLLAHPLRLPDPAVQLPARRVPDRLDRLRAAVDPGGRGHGLVRGRVRPDGHLDHPGRVQHRGHDHLLPGAGHALVPAADVRLGDAHHRLPARAGRPGAGRRHVHDHHRPHGADGVLRRPARRQLAICTRTCSGSSATPRSTSWRCRGSASSASSSRSSPGSRCSATRSPRRACSASRSCRSSSGSTTCSTPAWTRTCGRCSCSRRS